MKAIIVALLAGLGFGIFDLGTSNFSGPTVFSQLPISGGGYVVTGPDITGSSILSGSDVYGCQQWNAGASKWVSLETIAKAPDIQSTFGFQNTGCWSVIAAPSNTNYIAMYVGNGSNGMLLRSTDGGATFHDTGFHHNVNPNNGAQRIFGPKMAFDPANADVLYVGTYQDGVFRTSNFTTAIPTNISFGSAIASIPTESSSSYGGIAFDTNGGTTSGSTNIAYVGVPGHGIYQMTSPGGSFSLLSGSPSASAHTVVGPEGTVWVADNTNLYKATGCRSSCSWSTQSTGLSNISGVAVDPNACSAIGTCHVVAENGGGDITASSNGGSSWVADSAHNRIATDVPWLAQNATNEFFMSAGDIRFDGSGTLWFAEGIGVWTTTPNYSSSVTTNWTSVTKGIANLQGMAVLSPPGNTSKVVTTQQDRGTFTSDTVHEPSVQGVLGAIDAIVPAFTVDYASSDGITTVVEMQNGPTRDESSISPDGGTTWNPFPASSAGQLTTTTTTSCAAPCGTLTLTTVPSSVHSQMFIQDTTNPTALTGVSGGSAYVNTNGVSPGTPGTVQLNVSSSGNIGSGDTIVISWAQTPFRPAVLVLNANTPSNNNVLNVASVPSSVHPGQVPFDLSNSGCIDSTSGGPAQVLSTTSTTITMTKNVVSQCNSGDIVLFSATAGDTNFNSDILAVSTPTNMVYLESLSGAVTYTKDGGATWKVASIPGVELDGSGVVTNGSASVTGYSGNALNLTSGQGIRNTFGVFNGSSTGSVSGTPGSSSTFTMNTTASFSGTVLFQFTNFNPGGFPMWRTVCADRVNTGVFYLYSLTLGQIFKGTSGGDTWTNQGGSSLTGSPYNINANNGSTMMKCVPSQPGNLFITSGSHGGSDSFAKSTDGGQTWSTVPHVSQVWAFGFGKALPGGSGYPAIYAYGVLDTSGGQLGLLRSTDGGSTWTTLGGASEFNPVYSYSSITDIDGDKNIFGKVYGSFLSNSFFCGALSPGC